jgi:hypothetical protein
MIHHEPEWLLRYISAKEVAEKIGMNIRVDLFNEGHCVLFAIKDGIIIDEGYLDYIEPLVSKYQRLKAFL